MFDKKMMTIITGLILAIFITIGIICPAAAETVELGSIFKAPISNVEGSGLMDTIMKEAFSRIGAEVRIMPVSGSMALKKANEGIFGGDMMRVPNAEKNYPNLIPVKEKLYDFDFVAFSIKIKEPIKSWAELKSYRVAVPKGWVETDNNVSEENTKSLKRISSPFKLFDALMKDEADLIIFERLMGYEMIRELGLKDIHVVEPPLSSKEMYLYLHKKHKALVPKLAEAFKAMKADGTFKKIVDKTMSAYK